MKTINLVISILLSAMSSTGFAQKLETRFTFADSDAGQNTYQALPEGRFESVTELSLAGIKISSRLTGKITDNVLREYELVESRAGKEMRLAVASGKATVTAEGRSSTRDVKTAKALFANFHPQICSSIANAIDPASESQKVDLFILDGAVVMKADIVRRQPRVVEAGGERHAVKVFRLRFPTGLDVDVYVTEAGRTVAWNVPTQTIKAIAPGFEELVVDPTTRMPELSQPTMKTRQLKALKMKMRDGIELAADAALPDGNGKFPVILSRTPYGRGSQMATGDWWARRGYVYVAQDTRGRGDSDGEWDPFVNERKDGYDTIDWISKQPWCDGNVGMIGGSYVGIVQWWAAVERHPALKCIVPQVSPPDPFYNFPIDHGIPFLFGAVWWANVVKDKGPLTGLPTLKNTDALMALPITKADDAAFEKDVPWLNRWWEKETAASFGPANFMGDLNHVTIPALHISGWWDGDGIGTKMNWAAMRKLGRKNQWLIYGPWTHAFNTTSRIGDTDYGPNAILDLESVYLRWFDTWLKGKQAGLAKMPKVRVFLTGANEWRELSDWPDPRSTVRTLYLSATAPANGPQSAGELLDSPPALQEPDRYTYNPAYATIPKEITDMDISSASTVVKFEPRNQDTLLYKTAPLTEPVEMGGPVEIDLRFSSSAVDTDFYADVVDIDEKGAMRAIGRGGKIRAKYHRSFDKPELLQPGRIYKVAIEHWDVAHRFAKGHRIGLMITSDGFPLYARNLNTGEPAASATRMVAAHQTIYHDTKHPSALRFRILPASR